MPAPPSARCAKHVEAAAIDVCQRCGSFVCGECSNIRDEDVYCGDCALLLDRRPSGRPLAAFVLASAGAPGLLLTSILPFGFGPIVGVLVFLMVGPGIALSLLLAERAARKRKETPARGVFYRPAWVALSIDFALFLTVVAIAVYVVFIGATHD